MNPHLAALLDALVRLLAAVLATVLALYTPRLLAAIREHVQSKTAAEALAYVTAVAAQQVAAQAERVRLLKDPAHPEAGTWNPRRDGPALMAEVVEGVKAAAPRQVELLRAGLGQGRSLDAVLRAMGEAEVEKLRRAPGVLRPPTALPPPSPEPEAARPTTAPPEPAAPGASSR